MQRKGIIALMLSLGLLLSVCSACSPSSDMSKDSGSGTVSEATSTPGEDKPFTTAFRFLVASDIHLSSVTSTEAKRLQKLFESSYRYAEAQDYKTVDALVVVGDFTNYGYANEYAAFKSVVNASIKEQTTLITVMGNHEFYGGNEEVYTGNIDARLDKHIIVNGYHFIGLSTKGEDGYSAERVNWLKEELAKANEDDPDKPIITFQHHHIKDTVYVSSEWYTKDSAALNAAYAKYSQVLNFSGHSHGPVNNPTSVYQKDYTLFGTGTLSYFEMASGMTYGTIPPNSNQAAQFYIVEVSTENSVRVMPYNLITDEFFSTPSALDGEDEQLIYYIENLKDKSTWLYTDARKTTNNAPYFLEDAAAALSNIGSKTISVTIPQAVDDSCVYSYEFVCTAKSGSAVKFNYFSEYYFEPMPETLEFTLSGLKAGTEYTLEVFPYDALGKKGESIKAQFTTAEGESYVYKSENPVKYTGTFTDFNSITSLVLAKNTYAYGGKIDGDIFVGDWCTAGTNAGSKASIENGRGYEGSNALAVWSENKDNQGLYIFATEENKNATEFSDLTYLRVWADFTDVDFRKANFGLVSSAGGLFTTDESDNVPDLFFYYLPEGGTEWQRFSHGADGCFGTAQSASVKNFKGWFAFPTADFTYRSGTGTASAGSGVSYSENTISGVYMFWDYDDSINSGAKFYLDEIQLVEDYKIFNEYTNQ